MNNRPTEEVNVTLKMPRFILEEIDAQADLHDVSRSFMVCSIINGVLLHEENDCCDEDCCEDECDLFEQAVAISEHLTEFHPDMSVFIQPEGFQLFENGKCFIREDDVDFCEDCDCPCEM